MCLVRHSCEILTEALKDLLEGWTPQFAYLSVSYSGKNADYSAAFRNVYEVRENTRDGRECQWRPHEMLLDCCIHISSKWIRDTRASEMKHFVKDPLSNVPEPCNCHLSSCNGIYVLLFVPISQITGKDTFYCQSHSQTVTATTLPVFITITRHNSALAKWWIRLRYVAIVYCLFDTLIKYYHNYRYIFCQYVDHINMIKYCPYL